MAHHRTTTPEQLNLIIDSLNDSASSLDDIYIVGALKSIKGRHAEFDTNSGQFKENIKDMFKQVYTQLFSGSPENIDSYIVDSIKQIADEYGVDIGMEVYKYLIEYKDFLTAIRAIKAYVEDNQMSASDIAKYVEYDAGSDIFRLMNARYPLFNAVDLEDNVGGARQVERGKYRDVKALVVQQIDSVVIPLVTENIKSLISAGDASFSQAFAVNQSELESERTKQKVAKLQLKATLEEAQKIADQQRAEQLKQQEEAATLKRQQADEAVLKAERDKMMRQEIEGRKAHAAKIALKDHEKNESRKNIKLHDDHQHFVSQQATENIKRQEHLKGIDNFIVEKFADDVGNVSKVSPLFRQRFAIEFKKICLNESVVDVSNAELKKKYEELRDRYIALSSAFESCKDYHKHLTGEEITIRSGNKTRDVYSPSSITTDTGEFRVAVSSELKQNESLITNMLAGAAKGHSEDVGKADKIIANKMLLGKFEACAHDVDVRHTINEHMKKVIDEVEYQKPIIVANRDNVGVQLIKGLLAVLTMGTSLMLRGKMEFWKSHGADHVEKMEQHMKHENDKGKNPKKK